MAQGYDRNDAERCTMGSVPGLAAGLALVAAMLFAVATVAQQRSAATVPVDTARRFGLIRALVRRRLWWLGVAGDGGGYVAQAAALGVGSLLLVQPLLVSTLLFALPLSARWTGRTPSRSDWAWALLLTAALAGFVLAGDPTEGVDRAPLRDWVPAAGVLTVVLLGCLAGAAHRRGVARAVLLAAATAVCYGLAAALTKGVMGQFDEGPVAVLTSWETYLLMLVSALGTLLQQSAFQAGALTASLPTMIVGEPLVAVALGAAVLDEELRADGAEWVLIGALTLVMIAATVMLARSAAGSHPASAR